MTFTGRADARMVAEYLSSADVGLSPDPKSPLNDVSTMNKTMEYMTYALPVVTFDLVETRVSAGDAARYVPFTGDPETDVTAYAEAVAELLDDPDERVVRGIAGRRRAVAELDWAPQRARYVEVFDRLLGVDREAPALPAPAPAARTADDWGNELVDLDDAEALAAYVRDRGVGADRP